MTESDYDYVETHANETLGLRRIEGCRRLVFDHVAWTLAGHDVGDNSCFYKPATVVRVRRVDGEWVADVLFDHETRISRGHFITSLREAS